MGQKSVDSLATLILPNSQPSGKSDWNGMQVFVADPKALDKPVTDVGSDMPHDAASLTKMMTFYVTLKALQDNHIDPHDRSIRIPINQSTPDSKTGAKKGEVLTLPEALDGMMTASDNAAAIALSQWVEKNTPGGSFVKRMNAEAKNLHMKETEFYNVNGLPEHDKKLDKHAKEGTASEREKQIIKEHPNNTTTARDMARMLTALDRDHSDWTWEYMGKNSVSYGTHKNVEAHHHLLDEPDKHMPHTRPLLHVNPGDKVIAKTGYTDNAGHNIAAMVKSPEGRKLLVIVMGSKDASGQQAREAGVPADYIPKTRKPDDDRTIMNGTLPRDALVLQLFKHGLGESAAAVASGVEVATATVAPAISHLAEAAKDAATHLAERNSGHKVPPHKNAAASHAHAHPHTHHHAIRTEAMPFPLSDQHKDLLSQAQSQFTGAMASGGSVGAPAGKQKDAVAQLG